MEEVLKAVAEVNWRRLGEVLNETLGPYLQFNLDNYESDEARLRAVVEIQYTLSSLSWRVVIWALYCSNEIDKAQQIRSYAEPLRGTLMYVLRRKCIRY